MKNLLRFSLLALVLTIHSCSKDEDNGPGLPGNNLATGASARDILSAERFGKITFEIRYAPGFMPSAEIVADLQSFLSTYCNKPDGIEISVSEFSVPSKASYSIQDIRDIVKTERKIYNEPNDLALYLLLADKDYSENSGNQFTLGVAYQNTSTVIFAKTIRDNSGGLGQPSERLLISTVLQHELGHLMGLVNLGSSMQQDHEDDEHPRHCNVETCLMYWAIETSSSIGGMTGMSSPPGLDAQCQADLKANGGK